MKQTYTLKTDKLSSGQISDITIVLTNGSGHSVNLYCNSESIISDLRKLAYEIECDQMDDFEKMLDENEDKINNEGTITTAVLPIISPIL